MQHNSKCPKTYQNGKSSESGQKQGLTQHNGRNGLVGLQNLGNTCFMNSGLQCLSNTPELVQYYLTNQYQNNINTSNPLGAKGNLANAFAELMQKMWFDNQSVQSPWQIKKILGKFAPQFSGYSQHDSQEFLCYLLDGLHEDCNLVKKKPYIEMKDQKGRTDIEVAQETWNNHLKRNQSHIVDIMHGQYKSTLTCPQCKYISITFDPFCVLSLPIPNLEYQKVHAFLISQNLEEQIQKIQVYVSGECKAIEFKQMISNITQIALSQLQLVGVKSNKIKEIITDQKKIVEVADSCLIFAYELPEDYNLQENLIISLQIVQKQNQSYFSSKQNQLISFARAFFFKKSATCEQMHLQIFRFFYKQFINLDDKQRPIDQQKLQQEYEDNFIKSKEAPYTINIINSSKIIKGGFLRSDSKAPCDYCNSKECNNCFLPYKQDITLDDLIKKLKNFTEDFQLELVWSNNINKKDISLQNLNLYQEHANSESQKPSLQSQQMSLYKCFEMQGIEEQLEKDNA